MDPSSNNPQTITESTRGKYKLLHINYQGTSLCISKLSKYLVFGSREGHVVVMDKNTSQVLLDIALSNSSLWNVHISPDESTIIAGGASGTLYRVRFPSGVTLNPFNGHTSEINHCVFNNDGSYIYTGSDDGTIRKWNSNDGTSHIVLDHGRIVYAFDLSRDETFCASGDSSGVAKLLNLLTDELVEMNVNNSIWCIKISPSNKFIIAGDSAAHLTIWNITGELIRSIMYKHTDRLRSVAISNCEKYFASTGNDHLIKIWKTCGWDEEITYNIHTDWNKTVVYDSDNDTWISISDNRSISIVKTPSQFGGKIANVPGTIALFHPYLNNLIVAHEQFLYVCDKLTGEAINKSRVVETKNAKIAQMRICDNGMILVGTEKALVLVDYVKLQVIKKLEIDDQSSYAFTQKTIALVDYLKVKVLNSENFQESFEVLNFLNDKIVSVFGYMVVICSGNLINLYDKQKKVNEGHVDYNIVSCKQFESEFFYVITNVIHSFSFPDLKEIATARFIQEPIDLQVDSNFLFSITRLSIEVYAKKDLVLQRQIVFHQKILNFDWNPQFYILCTKSNEVYMYKSLEETYFLLDGDTQEKITLKS